jgi:hypothetical protein
VGYPGSVNGPGRGFVWTVCLTYVALALPYILVTEHRLPGARDALWHERAVSTCVLSTAGYLP